ncbi:malate dehydrogenase [Pseudoalteromonas sp. SS15]|jgi:malate dehydrogenase|uniref:Malate dehydrogenase n=1 Tax=Pseudoalteromonas phenolica TaxID=161398 RepID=A0A0S2K5D6_9GAMM|nr:malate dehydrogenase [Pseudoalteromonas phenolica]ALO43252.1 Malate dehydrogenase [Pseudoalteromonas phenolica]MBE0355592.1 malate dehydrogenase [Pseudoalteromonas phenolica O-BC30]RXF06769.1 malate dehydrogenase [Pseudoalteromonas phenolica O-BC30]RZQ53483.1 malate dehydrogenase [Pseudoalteromonas phenolica]TLX47543.1 malate dehydrogenase [Pseudoalteromonas phenolica]|tara:strand:+ start:845 stop:1786 length:942 start_codon:yes stop_codon:yes gene_type:complete
MKVAVLGAAGGIGQALSLLLKNGLPAGSELSLYDVAPVVPGVAVDLSHIPTAVKVAGFGADDLDAALAGADIVLIPAGMPRKPGMDRADLFNVNAGIIKTLAEGIVRNCPKALVGVITNPVNGTVPIVAEVFKKAGTYEASRVFGVTTLDVIRSEAFVAELKGVDVSEVKVPVIGGHSGTTILPLLSQVEGVEFTEEEVAALTPRIQNAGTEVVNAKAGGGSATLSMGAAAARFCFSLVKGLQGEQNVVDYAYVAVENGDAAYFAHPVRLGTNGVEEILSYGELSAFEEKAKNDMLETLNKDIQEGIDFMAAQ